MKNAFTLCRDLEPEGTIRRTIHTTGCHGDPAREINHLEHVEVHVRLEAKYRGDINMILFSPMGMRSEILRVRPNDDNKQGIDFTFMTVMAWGENPTGDWTLEVRHRPPSDSHRLSDSGRLLSWNLTLYGTAREPTSLSGANLQEREPAKIKKAHTMNEVDLKHTITAEEQRSDHLAIRKEVEGGSNSPDVHAHKQRPANRRAQGDDQMEDLLAVLQDILDDDQRNEE